MTPKPKPQKVERVAVDTLRPDPDNARIHGRDNLRAIRASLTRFGQVRPLLITGDGMVLAGNGTLEAIKSLGWTEVDVIRLPWTDPDQCRAYAIADNRTAELASWDRDTLAEQIGDLGESMGELGFDTSIAQMLADESADESGGAGGGSTAQAERAYRCPACGFRWRYEDGEEVVPL